MSLVVNNPSANVGGIEIQVRSLGQEDSLEEDMVTHSSIVAWRIPWTKEPGRLQYWSELPCLLPGDLPNPETEPTAPLSPTLAGRFSATEPPGSPSTQRYGIIILNI